MTLREICNDLTQKYNLTIVTEIYQGESKISIGCGVCRAVVAHWIGANLSASASGERGLVTSFQQKAGALHTGETAESFVAHQKDFDFHHSEQEKAYEKYKELRKEEEKLGDQIENYKTSWFGPTKESLEEKLDSVGKQRDEAYAKALKLGKNLSLYTTMFVAEPESISKKGFTLRKLLESATQVFAAPGFYYISIGSGQHAWGFYVSHMTTACMFIDPNTCEWIISNVKTAAYFLSDYTLEFPVYKSYLDKECAVLYVVGGMLYEPIG